MAYTPSVASLKAAGGMGFPATQTPSMYKRAKLTPRDRDIMREIFEETPATRRELALAFGVSRQTILDSTS